MNTSQVKTYRVILMLSKRDICQNSAAVPNKFNSPRREQNKCNADQTKYKKVMRFQVSAKLESFA